MRSCLAAGLGVVVVASLSVSAAGQLPPLRLEQYASGFNRPVGFVQHPTDPSLQFILEQSTGRIRIIQNGVVLGGEFLNIGTKIATGGSQGLLGLAFPPDYDASGAFYVYYTDLLNDSVVARYHRDANDPLLADPDSEEILMSHNRPTRIHYAGHMEFGPDGMLYLTTGDGGLEDVNSAQDPDSMLGKMLRLDVSTPTGYAIPADNPFVDGDPIDALGEIWSFGLRNPWTFTFDRPELGGTGGIFIADVGALRREELNYEPPNAAGRNYGWRNREGTLSHNNSEPPAYEPLIDPLHDYQHPAGQAAIIGGYRYRGTALGSAYRGRYFFADINQRRVWTAGIDILGNGEAVMTDLVEHTAELGTYGSSPAFGMDADGELYLLSFNGRIYRIVTDATTDVVDVEIATGNILAGDLSSILASDNSYLQTRSGFGQTFIDLHNMNLLVTAQTNVSSPSMIDLAIESRISHPSGSARVRLRNWSTGQFVQVSQYPINQTEATVVVADIPAANYIDGTGTIEASIQHLVFVPIFAFRFDSFFDLIDVTVE